MLPIAIFSEPEWRKATYSLANVECIEAASSDRSGHIGVRDSKDRNGALVVCTTRQWSSFISSIKA
jgi:Domain of unknown function (DUF397)